MLYKLRLHPILCNLYLLRPNLLSLLTSDGYYCRLTIRSNNLNELLLSYGSLLELRYQHLLSIWRNSYHHLHLLGHPLNYCLSGYTTLNDLLGLLLNYSTAHHLVRINGYQSHGRLNESLLLLYLLRLNLLLRCYNLKLAHLIHPNHLRHHLRYLNNGGALRSHDNLLLLLLWCLDLVRYLNESSAW
jgi:hypothetical protein